MVNNLFYSIVFIFFFVLKALILSEADSLNIPTFESGALETDITFEFVEVGGLDAIADAIKNLVEVFRVIGLVILVAFQLIFDSIVYAGTLLFFIFLLAFQSIDGVPSWVNFVILGPLSLGWILHNVKGE